MQDRGVGRHTPRFNQSKLGSEVRAVTEHNTPQCRPHRLGRLPKRQQPLVHHGPSKYSSISLLQPPCTPWTLLLTKQFQTSNGLVKNKQTQTGLVQILEQQTTPTLNYETIVFQNLSR